MTVPTVRYFSYGGGVDSTAVLVLSAQGTLPYTDFIFANVGDDTEGQETFDYLRDHAIPYATRHGIRVHTIKREFRDGSERTLYQDVINPDRKSIGIPMFSSQTGAPMMRRCTVDWKLNIVGRWLKTQGITKGNRVTVGIGFAAEEAGRAARMTMGDQKAAEAGKPRHAHYDVEFPLIELGLDRAACQELIVAAGLPECPRSCCWFCPYRTMEKWREIRDEQPETWQKIIDLETTVNTNLADAGISPMYLTRSLVPIELAVEGWKQKPLDKQPKEDLASPEADGSAA